MVLGERRAVIEPGVIVAFLCEFPPVIVAVFKTLSLLHFVLADDFSR